MHIIWLDGIELMHNLNSLCDAPIVQEHSQQFDAVL